ncbi:MAG: hypothetical protein AAGC60_15540 [Acidobacteriota bacterium]
MIPRSVYNLLLVIVSVALVRLLLFAVFELEPQLMEMLSVAGVAATATLGYRLVSSSARQWITGRIEHSLSTVGLSRLLYAVIVLTIAGGLLTAQEVYTWKGPRTLEIQVDGTPTTLEGVATEDEEGWRASRSVLAWRTREIMIDDWSKQVEARPLRPVIVSVPFYVTVEASAKSREIEDLLGLVVFQWRRDELLDDAEYELATARSSDQLTTEELERLDLIHKIVRLTFDEREVDDPRRLDRLVERFHRLYPEDPWCILVDAAGLYAAKDFQAAAEVLAATRGDRPVSASWTVTRRFFESLCLLQAGRLGLHAGGELSPVVVTRAATHLDAAERELASRDDLFAEIALPSTLIYRGILFFYGKNWSHAEDAFARAAEHGSGMLRARALNGLGFIQFIRSDLVGAEKHFVQALEEESSYVTSRLNLGYVALARGEYQHAEEIFRQVHETWRGDPAHRYNQLATLGIAHAVEAAGRPLDDVIAGYALALRSGGFSDYDEVREPEVRLAYQLKAAGDSIYKDKMFFGLEILALTMYSRAGLYLHDSSSTLADDLAAELAHRVESTRGGVHEAWLYSVILDRYFSPIQPPDVRQKALANRLAG